MPPMTDTHFEEFVNLADLTHEAVLIAWGGFWFRRAEPSRRWQVVGRRDLPEVDPGRTGTIGADAEPYGAAVVSVTDADGVVVAEATAREANHVWVTGLRPDTRYHYRVTVDGVAWAAGERWDWGPAAHGGRDLGPRGRSYATTFRTHPGPDTEATLGFAVLGDFGVGVCSESESSRRQAGIAAVLDRLVETEEARLVLTTGDNVYEGGDADEDWYACFHQPYRYARARVPVFPTVGNHDSGETERSDNRTRLYSNLHVEARFASPQAPRRSSTDQGLFYRFPYGSDVEFVCVDTSEGLPDPYPHFYEHPDQQEFLRAALATDEARPRWRFAFGHHPPYCAGPDHDNDEPAIHWVVPLLRNGGVDAVFSGHEHNFQTSTVDGVTYFVTGAGGNLTEQPPDGFERAHTDAWAAEAHLIHVRLDGSRMAVTPLSGLAADGSPLPLVPSSPDGAPVTVPFSLTAAR